MSAQSQIKAELALCDDMAMFYDDPYGWVMYSFDWGVGQLKGQPGPDKWQREFLIEWGREIKDRKFDGITPVLPIRFATASGHGIGKSSLSAWIMLFIMSTRPMSKGVVTANTGEQLKTKTWAELAKWHSLCIVGHWFEWTASSLVHKGHPATWRVDAQTCREENSEAFAGLHAAESTPWYLFDEASAIPDRIWEVSRGGLTDGEPMHFAFGNPTRNTGEFRQCFNDDKGRWITRQIDSRTCRMTNKSLIQEWADDYGENSDYFKVRVRGEFPSAGDMQFISTELAFQARKRSIGQYLDDDPLICSIDVARGGDDDCRMGFRQGFDARSRTSYRVPGEKAKDTMVFVAKVVTVLERERPDVIFVDATGIGGPLGDRLRQLGFNAVDVHFGAKADDETKYANKTAEMAARFERWLRDGGAIIDDPKLEKEITERDYWHDDKDRLVIQKKKDVKKLIGRSPDWADQHYLLFAQHVPTRQTSRANLDRRSPVSSDYAPLDHM